MPWCLLGGHNKLPQTGELKQQTFVSHGSGGQRGGFHSEVMALGLRMSTILLCAHMTSLCPLWGEKGERAPSGAFSDKDTNPMGRGPHPYDLI